MKNEKDQIVFISSYPPRECGIATFTQDLTAAISRMFEQSFEIKICALEEDDTIKRKYPDEVNYRLNTADINQCRAVAKEIEDNDRITSVVIEHEFGLFKGDFGDHIFYLLNEISKPVFTCFHTVLENPEPKMFEVVKNIAAKSAKIIVLTAHSRDILSLVYGIDAADIVVIPHGVHNVKPVTDRKALKGKYGFEDRVIMGTFGLISSNKGIETALEAIAALPDRKNILYLVMGRTHPCVLKEEGEQYRDFLIRKTYELGIEDHVLFINKYLELNELLTYLRLTDIYLFTSKDPSQTVSGTLSYSMGAGCTVVSTPIPHAKEMLHNGGGYIFDFGNSEQLRDIIVKLISSPEEMKRTSVDAARIARQNTWENVANKFAKMFREHHQPEEKLSYTIPSLKLNHFCRLTTTTGMLQFSNMCDPDPASGYTTDDNARALYVLTLYNELYPDDQFASKYFNIYLSFLQKAICDNGSFLNYIDYNGEFTAQNQRENLEESNARVFVALTRFLQSPRADYKLKLRAHSLILRASKFIYNMQSPRSMAKVIKGLYFLNLYDKDAAHMSGMRNLSDKLVECYNNNSREGWEWYESAVTYNNSAIPEGLIYAYLATNNPSYKKTALSSFRFLMSKMFVNGRLRVISNNGWLQKEEKYVHGFGEQPIEVAAMMEALYIFYQATGETAYRECMSTAFSWFLGNNHLNRLVYDPASGGCHDGIEEFEVNINQGAESTLSYIVSRLTMDKLRNDEQVISDLLTVNGHKINVE